MGSKNSTARDPAAPPPPSSFFSGEEEAVLARVHAAEESFGGLWVLEEIPWFRGALRRALAESASSGSGGCNGGPLSREAFVTGMALACRGRRRDSFNILCSLAQQGSARNASGASAMGAKELKRTFEAAYYISLRSSSSQTTTPDADANADALALENKKRSPFDAAKLVAEVLQSVGGENKGGAEGVSVDEFFAWSEAHAPLLHTCLATYLQLSCLGRPIDTTALFIAPTLPQTSALLENRPAELFRLAIFSRSFQGKWTRLFTTEEDGLSFNRLWHSIAGYAGPSLILVKDRNTGAIFGGLALAPWKEGNSFYGEPGGMLLQLEPNLQIRRATPGGPAHYQYANLKGFSLPHGLGMGGDIDSFRFFVSESLERRENWAKSSCLTFERGELCPSPDRHFEVDTLEVWGVGGDELVSAALEARFDRRAATQEALQRARKVDKAKFAENAFDREMLLSKTFGGGGGRGGVGAEDVREK